VQTLTICTDCKKTINVEGPNPPAGVIRDNPIVIYCPGCGFPNMVIWRKATPYSVTLADRSK